MICRHELFTIHLHRAGANEWCLTAALNGRAEDPASAASAVYREVASFLSQTSMEIVQERVFAPMPLHPSLMAARNRVLRDAENGCPHPITFTHGCSLWENGIAGMQIYAVKAADPVENVWTLFGENGPCGRAWSRNGASFFMLQALRDFPGTKPSINGQTDSLFECARRVLAPFDLSYRDVARAWLYLPACLHGCGDFDAIQNSLPDPWGGTPENAGSEGEADIPFPAGTGMPGKHPSGAACAMDILAVKGPDHAPPIVAQMTGPREPDAHRREKIFSRGACIRSGNDVTVHLSGTAAIGGPGENRAAGDPRKQIVRTFDHIESLLAPAGIGLGQIAGATLLFKHADDWALCQKVLAERGLEDFPAVPVLIDTCGDGFLFAIDGIACASQP
jgi:enamine deaminase RidA (YjgF/YER057c/UK114 family)